MFRFEIDRSVAVGRFDSRVAEPLADGHQLDACTQQMDGRAVPAMP